MPIISPWMPEQDAYRLRRLGKSLEELGELVAVLGRAVCQGVAGVDPASGETNLERMLKESADVVAQIGCNVEAFSLDQARMQARVVEKAGQMALWEDLLADQQP